VEKFAQPIGTESAAENSSAHAKKFLFSTRASKSRHEKECESSEMMGRVLGTGRFCLFKPGFFAKK
jgi:hypothetical protein